MKSQTEETKGCCKIFSSGLFELLKLDTFRPEDSNSGDSKRPLHPGQQWVKSEMRRSVISICYNKWCTPMDPFTWPSESRAASSNLHTAALWGYECSPEDLPEAMNDMGGGERGSGISVLMARQDDDDNL